MTQPRVGQIGRSATSRHLAEWLKSPILWILVTAIMVPTGYYGVKWLLAEPALESDQTIVKQPASVSAAQPFDSTQGKPVQQAPQNVQENVVPASPVVVDYRGEPWHPVKNLNPLKMPVEEGFYDGTWAKKALTTSGKAEVRAYAFKIYPEFKDNAVVLAAMARDPVDKNVVLLSVFVYDFDKPTTKHIALSVDGERSWCNLDLLPVDSGSEATNVRVVADGNLIHLYGMDNRTGYHWWEKVVTKNELPCS